MSFIRSLLFRKNKLIRKRSYAGSVHKHSGGSTPAKINHKHNNLIIPVLVVSIGFIMLSVPYFSGISALTLRRNPVSLPDEVNTAAQVTESTASANTDPIRADTELLNIREPSQPPSRIVIPKHSIDLSVVEAKVKNGFWETSETQASHGIGSANPSDRGNIVIFAHARNGLFGPIRNISLGTQVYILTKDHWFTYVVDTVKLVAPDAVEVIRQTDKETLTLFTCSGFLDSKRLVVTAVPQK